ncbi:MULTISPECIES: GNAT family N-acetyltransferase [Bacillaceae]|uniref:GNAT family N-acetyltransferase n=1 Tax=Evansella alkalicola TaxID=745819 RepID=A0ABS6JZV3_9BACI|nr:MULTISPECIES: GNAT family N-acetyltransferase [Bacillaceae]MBU9722742.1 GNAT family N-acetyltransferase [Bacillus alkalicola]
MSNKNIIQKIEELSINALPALQTQMVDGWILRFANGYTKRANSINPIYPSNEEIKDKIERMSKIYRDKNLKVVYKLTTNVIPVDLDSILDGAGYKLEGLTSVQLLPLNRVDEVEPASNVNINHHFDEKWFRAFCTLNNVKATDQTTLKKMLQSIVPEVCYVSIINNRNEPIACGMGVLDDEFIGLFDIVTDIKHRNKGYAKQLIFTLVNWGKKNGAENAYLQVVSTNRPALNLYSKLGFEEVYKYWYRIKD